MGRSGGRTLLLHAMRQDLDRTPLHALRVLHHLLRVEARMLLLLRGHVVGRVLGVLAADALRAILALLWVHAVALHQLRLLVHVRLHLMRGPGDAAHRDVLLHVLRRRMLLGQSRLPDVLGTGCRHMLLLAGPLMHRRPVAAERVLMRLSRGHMGAVHGMMSSQMICLRHDAYCHVGALRPRLGQPGQLDPWVGSLGSLPRCAVLWNGNPRHCWFLWLLCSCGRHGLELPRGLGPCRLMSRLGHGYRCRAGCMLHGSACKACLHPLYQCHMKIRLGPLAPNS